MVLALVLFPTHGIPAEYFPSHPIDMILMLLGELFMGMVLALMVYFVFAAIQTGGQIIGFQMGFAMVNVVDPITGVSEAVTAHFMYMVALLIFLSLNGHLHLFKALSESFKLVPPGSLIITDVLVNNVMGFSKTIFVLAVKIAAPIMAALFMVDLALALVGRAAPQMNILIVGFPVKIAVGFYFLGMLFVVLSDYLMRFISTMVPMYRNLLHMMQ